MNIPLTYTLEFFQKLFLEKIEEMKILDGIILFSVYRNSDQKTPQKSDVSYFFEIKINDDILSLQRPIKLDLIKEINVNTNILSNIRVHCPENIYAEIYAEENDLDDIILLNPEKRIARSIFGNLLFLEGEILKTPKTSEGAYISPLMENFITFIHKNNLAEIEPSEILPFESQKADEILMISDEKGIFPVEKIRNKTFESRRFSEILERWHLEFEI